MSDKEREAACIELCDQWCEQAGLDTYSDLRARLAAAESELKRMGEQEPVGRVLEWIGEDGPRQKGDKIARLFSEYSCINTACWKVAGIIYTSPVPAAQPVAVPADHIRIGSVWIGEGGWSEPIADFRKLNENTSYVIYAAPSPLATRPSAPADDVVRDADVGAAIERAAKELPRDYCIEIEIENGAATVSLYDDEFCLLDHDPDGETLASEINAAIDAALLAASAQSSKKEGV